MFVRDRLRDEVVVLTGHILTAELGLTCVWTSPPIFLLRARYSARGPLTITS